MIKKYETIILMILLSGLLFTGVAQADPTTPTDLIGPTTPTDLIGPTTPTDLISPTDSEPWSLIEYYEVNPNSDYLNVQVDGLTTAAEFTYQVQYDGMLNLEIRSSASMYSFFNEVAAQSVGDPATETTISVYDLASNEQLTYFCYESSSNKLSFQQNVQKGQTLVFTLPCVTRNRSNWESSSLLYWYITSWITLPEPTIILSESEVPAGKDITAAVGKIEGAKYYNIRIYALDEYGQETVLTNNGLKANDTEHEVCYQIPGYNFVGEGTYRIDAWANASGKKASRILTVTGSATKARLSIRGAAPYYRASKVTFEFGHMFDAVIVNISKDGRTYPQIISSDDGETVSREFSEDGIYSAYGTVKKDGRWMAYSEVVTFEVVSRGQLDAPVIQIDSAVPQAGKDLKFSYSLDRRADSGRISIDYRYSAGSTSVSASQSYELDCSSTEFILTGASIAKGDYVVTFSCHGVGYDSSTETVGFSVTGDREEGPALFASTNDTYVNNEITFSTTMEGATALRARYQPFNFTMGYLQSDKELYADNGIFSWSAAYPYSTSQEVSSWYVWAMCLIDDVWTDWGEPAVVTIRSRGMLEMPTFISVPTELHQGQPLHVTVSEVPNATEYDYRLEKQISDETGITYELLKEWRLSNNDVTLIEKGDDLQLSEGVYYIRCRSYAYEYVMSQYSYTTFTVIATPALSIQLTDIRSKNDIIKYYIGLNLNSGTPIIGQAQSDPYIDSFYIENYEALSKVLDGTPIWSAILNSEATGAIEQELFDNGRSLHLWLTDMPISEEYDTLTITVEWGDLHNSREYILDFINPGTFPTGIDTDFVNALVVQIGDVINLNEKVRFTNGWNIAGEKTEIEMNGNDENLMEAGIEKRWDDSVEESIYYAKEVGIYDATISVRCGNVRWIENFILYIIDDDGTIPSSYYQPQDGKILLLPVELERIEDYAFEGTAADIIVIQDSCTIIGAFAFANMPNLKEVYIPSSVMSIDPHAFDGCGLLVIHSDSQYVTDYARNHGMIALV